MDETYDELDALVSQHSKALYEMQAKIAKDCEDKIIKIKEMALQASNYLFINFIPMFIH